MKKWFSIITVALVTLILCSCQGSMKRHPEGRPYKIALIHTYDALQESYQRFNKVALEEFEKERIDVDLSTYYMDIYKGTIDLDKRESMLRILKKLDPDMILLDDDLGALTLLTSEDNFLKEKPLILGNIHMPEKGDFGIGKLLKGYRAACLIDPLDFKENIRIASELSKNNLIEIEMDFNEGEMHFREELRKSIASEEFLDNTDFHDMYLDYNSLNGRLKDKTIVMVYSLQEPERNVGRNDSLEGYADYGKERTQNMLKYSRYYPSLVVKKDLYANGIAISTGFPQFTVVNVDFGNSNNSFAAGYFCPMEDIAKDMVSYAVRVINGEDILKLPIGIHQQKRMINWPALLDRQPEYENQYHELAKKYTIVNAPFQIQHPTLYWALIVGVLVTISLIVILTIVIWNRKIEKKNKEIREQLLYDKEYGNLVFLGVNSCTFHYDKIHGLILGENSINNLLFPEGLDAFNKIALMIKPSYIGLVEKARKSINTEGEYSFTFPITLDRGFSFHWLQLRYKVSKRHDMLEANGLIIDADDIVERENQVKEAQKKAIALELKEKFLTDLRDYISVPLNKILKYSDILSEKTARHTTAEYIQTVKELNEEGHTLMNIVNKILELVRMESGRVKMDIQPINVATLFRELQQRWKETYSSPIEIETVLQADEKLCVMADKLRIEQMLDILMENAIRFGNGKAIKMGYVTNKAKDDVELYISDNGKGIDKEYAKLIQQRFLEQKNFDLKMGLNLNIANAIAWNMNAQLSLDSNSEGGTRIGILIKKEEKE